MAEMCLERLEKRVHDRYLDELLRRSRGCDRPGAGGHGRGRGPISIGWLGNAVDLLEALLERGIVPDALTDQTSAHDPLNGYYPQGLTREAADALRRDDPERVRRALDGLDAAARRADGRAAARGASHLRLRQQHPAARPRSRCVKDAFAFPGFVPAYIRPQFCLGRGPFRWAALSGDPQDIRVTDEALLELFPEDESLHRWIQMATRTRRLPGAAVPDLLARAWASATGRGCVSTSWCATGRSRRRSSSDAITSTAARSLRPTARRRP